METITNWFNGLDSTLRMYWIVTIFSSTIFIIQMLMSFIGIGDLGDADVDADFSGGDVDGLDDAGAMSLISIRNVIYFLLGMGWGGVCLWNTIPNKVLLLVVSVLVGCAFVAMFIMIFRQLMRLQQNGAVDIRDAKDKVCDVYLRIPAENQGLGKVQISLGGSIHEFDARTESAEVIASGTKVRVLEVQGQVLLVEPIQ